MRVNVPIYLPTWAYKTLRHIRYGARNVPSNGLTLSGDRDIEWSFVVSRMPTGSGEALDFGASFGHLSISAAQKGISRAGAGLGSRTISVETPKRGFFMRRFADSGLAHAPFRSDSQLLFGRTHRATRPIWGGGGRDGRRPASDAAVFGTDETFRPHAADDSVRTRRCDRTLASGIWRTTIAEAAKQLFN